MRLKFLLINLILVLAQALLSAQADFKIKGCIKNLPFNKVYLSAISARNNTVIDSCIVNNGCFDFYLDTTKKAGMYSVILDKKTNAYIRIIFNNENIEFYSDLKFLLDSMRFTQSIENKLFYDNAKYVSRHSRKSDLLNRIVLLYDKDEPFARRAREELLSLDKAYENYVTETMSGVDGTLFRNIFGAQQQIKVPENLKGENRQEYLREHYLENVDFSCEALLGTDIMPGLISNYMSLFESNTYTRTEQELSYIKGVEDLLIKSRVNENIFRFVTEELMNMFQYGDFDIVGAYVKEKYALSGMCETEAESTELIISIEKIRRVSVGKPAPEMEFTDRNGNDIRLYGLSVPYTLIVFWSTSCPHCTNMLPLLSRIYKSRNSNSFEVIAIANDTDRLKWLNFLSSGDYPWINYCEPIVGENKIFRDYNIIGTPTFFLLNDDKIIISKPNTINEVYNKLWELGLIR